MCKFWKREKCNHHFPELISISGLNKINLFLNKKIVVSLTSIIVLILGFFYLTQTNITATKGYKIKVLEKELQQLTEDNKKLNLDYISLQSIDNIKKEAENLKLIPTTEIESLTLGETSIALR